MQERLQAEEALKEAATQGEPEACLASLLSATPADTSPGEKAPAAEASEPEAAAEAHLKLRVQCLVLVLSRMSSKQLQPHLGAVMPLLLCALGARNASTRRAAVLAYVAAHIVVGRQAVGPWAMQLSPMQTQLVQVYLDRQASLQAQVLRSAWD